MHESRTTPEAAIFREADRCVKCGLCLPHCPTYGLLRDEGDSPRGRIALMQGLAGGQLALSARLERHLDRCLACGACERICPSGVQYDRLLTDSRTLIEHKKQQQGKPMPRLKKLAMQLLINTPGRRRLYALLRLATLSGLRRLARKLGLLRLTGLRRADTLLPRRLRPPVTLPAFNPGSSGQTGKPRRVALFSGCSGDTLDSETLQAAVTLLTACGVDVHVPPQQTCCGTLHAHHGQDDTARRLAASNQAAFEQCHHDSPLDAVVYFASGCGQALQHLPAPAIEISTFLAGLPGFSSLRFTALGTTAQLHSPCTLPGTGPAMSLLQRIPSLDVRPMEGKKQCCGAAGSYMLEQVDISRALGRQTADNIDGDTTVLLTSNIGCALQLAASLREQDRQIEVMHPVALLARQLSR